MVVLESGVTYGDLFNARKRRIDNIHAQGKLF